MNNKSPLRYPGGKTRACKLIEKTLHEYTDMSQYQCICSPFFGGGSFEFYLQNAYGLRVFANDKFTPLYNFWQTAKTENSKLCALLKTMRPVSKEQFKTFRNSIMTLGDTLQQAALYFAINRCSFSGATLSGGFSQEAANKRFTESSITRIQNLDLSNVSFCNCDFIKFLSIPNEHSLLFLDPPYYLEKGSKLYGKNGDMHEKFDHDSLAQILKDKNHWILCYNDCSHIRELYKDFTIVEVNWSYGMNKTKKSSEILILSFS